MLGSDRARTHFCERERVCGIIPAAEVAKCHLRVTFAPRAGIRLLKKPDGARSEAEINLLSRSAAVESVKNIWVVVLFSFIRFQTSLRGH
jgi:hypothetical protein